MALRTLLHSSTTSLPGVSLTSARCWPRSRPPRLWTVNRRGDVLVSRQVGPAEVLLSAPAVIAALPDGTSRHMVAHLPVDSLVIGLDAGAITARGAGFLQSNPAAAGVYLAAGVGPVQAVLALLLGEMDGQMSVLGLIRAEFRPTGFQLGFGFSLDAVGGLIGVNRRADVDELRRRLSDGTAADSLFGGTTSSTAGILATLRALDRMFPVALGSVVVGPTLRLGWLTVGTYSLARADVGVILELPRGRVVVPGRVIIEVPGPSLPLVHLRLDMLGEVDPAARLLAADAALVDSTVVGAFSVNGTAALRLSWGDAPYAVVTVGGFYPGFDPSPAVIPLQRRISLVLSNPIPAGLSIHAEGYFAVGAGTLQMGGSLNVSFEIAESGISGSVGVDALVQLSPLWFTATVTGSVQLHAFGIELMGVQVRGDLTGPGPLVLTAEARGKYSAPTSAGGIRSSCPARPARRGSRRRVLPTPSPDSSIRAPMCVVSRASIPMSLSSSIRYRPT